MTLALDWLAFASAWAVVTYLWLPKYYGGAVLAVFTSIFAVTFVIRNVLNRLEKLEKLMKDQQKGK